MKREFTLLKSIQEVLQKEQFKNRVKLLTGLAIFFIAGFSLVVSLFLSKATHPATDSVEDIHSTSKVLGAETINWRGVEQGIYYGSTTQYGYSGIATGVSPENDNAEPLLRIQLSGLEPGKTYHYKIGLNGIDHTFKTMSLTY